MRRIIHPEQVEGYEVIMCTNYILRCADNKLYVGSTTNIEERLK